MVHGSSWDGKSVYTFKANGFYFYTSQYPNYDWGEIGNYNVKNGMVTFTYQYVQDYNGVGLGSSLILWSDWETTTPKNITFDTVDGKQYMKIGTSSLWYIKD